MKSGILLAAGAAIASSSAASAAPIFSANFNDYTNGAFPDKQAGTGLNVYATGDVPHWTHSANFHAIHAVERSPNDFAVMFYDTDIIYYDTPLAVNTLGQTYTLSFDSALAVYSDARQITGPGGYLDIRLNDARGIVASYRYTPTTTAFTAASFTYTGTGTGNVYLLIQDGNASDGRFGGAIDNIAINAVPEPATWGMMVLGFGAIGATIRRRRTAKTGVRVA